MEIYLILIFMIGAAIVAVEIKDLISSVIALSAVGLGLSLTFLLLKAPSLAITQLVVEILLVIVLVRGTIKKDLPLVIDGRWVFNTVSTLLFIASFLLFAYFALKELPSFGQPLMKVSENYITEAVSQTGVTNVVSAITLDYRSYDALAEVVIVFIAMVGVLAITRKASKIDGKE
ncbi:MAG: hydrogen gas-evolving membrane-bound hydrogenase subunit E [Candidatus Omnitrophota bacterium]